MTYLQLGSLLLSLYFMIEKSTRKVAKPYIAFLFRSGVPNSEGLQCEGTYQVHFLHASVANIFK